MTKRLRYEQPPAVSTKHVLELLASSPTDTAAIQEGLVGIALHESDLGAAYDVVVRGAHDVRVQVRATALLCIGHLARLHGTLPDEQSIDLIAAGLDDDDPTVRGQALNAAADLEVFTPKLHKKLRQARRKPSR